LGFRVTMPGVAWDQILTLLAPVPLALLANLAERGPHGWEQSDGPLPALRAPSPREVGRESASDVKRGTIPPGWVGFVRAPSALGWFTWAVLLVIAAAFFLLGAATALLAPASTRSNPASVAAFGLLEAASALVAGALLLRPVR